MKKIKLISLYLGALALISMGPEIVSAEEIPSAIVQQFKNFKRLTSEQKEQLKIDYAEIMSSVAPLYQTKGRLEVQALKTIGKNLSLGDSSPEDNEMTSTASVSLSGGNSGPTWVSRYEFDENSKPELTDTYVISSKLSYSLSFVMLKGDLDDVVSYTYDKNAKVLKIQYLVGDYKNMEEGVFVETTIITPNELEKVVQNIGVAFFVRGGHLIQVSYTNFYNLSRILSIEEFKSLKESLKSIKDCREMDEEEVDNNYKSCPVKDLSALQG